jgi:hypothetical protein
VSDDLLQAHWSQTYRPEWDVDPEQYLRHGLLEWGHSRRLARFDDQPHAFKAYIGIHHSDPATWGAIGQARVRYFLSLFISGKTVAMHTYDTIEEARAALTAFHQRLVNQSESPG